MTEKIENQDIYDNNWGKWRKSKIYGPASRFLRYLIFDLLKDIPENELKTIINVGCGEGTNTYFLAKRFPNAKVLGVDFSKTGIELANRFYTLPNLEFVHDTQSKSLEKQYDLVTCFEVLEHIEVWEPFLDKLVESSNHYMCLSFPTGRMRPFETRAGHFRNFKKGEVEAYLGEKGIKTIDTNYGGWPFYSPIYRDILQKTSSQKKALDNKFDNNEKASENYSWLVMLVANTLYFFFRYLSTKNRKGDKFCGIFSR